MRLIRRRVAVLLALMTAGFAPADSLAQSFTLTVPLRPATIPQIARVKIAFESASIGPAPQVSVDGAAANPTQPCTVDPVACNQLGFFGTGDQFQAKWVTPGRMEVTITLNGDFAGSFCASTRMANRVLPVVLTNVAANGYRMASYAVPEMATPTNPAPRCDEAFRRVTTLPASMGAVAGVTNLGRLPIDVVLVLDKSGSMGWDLPDGPAGESRWERLDASVQQFMALYKQSGGVGPLGTSVEGSPDDRIGLVFFDTSPTDGLLDGGSIFKRRLVTGWDAPAPANNVVSAQIALQAPGGWTSIGGGVERARVRQVALTDANDPIFVVFTDGEQNTDPLIQPDPMTTAPLEFNSGSLSGTRLMDMSTPVLTIGLGATAGPFAELLNQIAHETAGQSRITTGGMTLDLNFADQLVAALKGNTLSLMTRRTELLPASGTGTPITPTIDGSVTRAVFVLGWEGRRHDGRLGLRITDPNGVVVSPSVVEAGRQYVVASVDIPQSGPAGEWHVQAVSATQEQGPPVNYHLSAYAVEGRLDYRFTITPGPVGTGEPVVVRAEVGYDGLPLDNLPAGAIRIHVDRPGENLGNLLAESQAKGDPQSGGGETQSPVSAKIDQLAEGGDLLDRIEPRPATVLNATEVGDGVYQAAFDQTVVGGQYRFRVEMDWNDPRTTRIRRTETIERQVPVLPTEEDTRVEVRRDRDRVVILVTPQDRFGNLVGPGYDRFFTVQVAPPAQVDTIRDPGVNGTYAISITNVPPGADPRVRIVFRDRPLRDAPLSELARGQGPGGGRLSFGIRAGVAVPHGDFDTEWDLGVAIDADLELALTRSLAFQVVGGYRSFTDAADSTLSIMRVSGNLKLYLGAGAFRPFVNGGAGVYVVDPGETNYGANLGAGLQLWLGNRLGVEAAYNYYAIKQPVLDPTFSTLEAGFRLRL